jgi:holo-[acyl-carrier protein] synthase
VILGLGSDLIDITRVARSIARFGDRFINRCFTDVEKARAARRPLIADASYAKRFAAKEACAKALGTGMRAGVFWRDMSVVNLPGGRPTMVLTGGALERLKAITPPGMTARIDLTITDEPPLAQAMVIISAIPAEPAS